MDPKRIYRSLADIFAVASAAYGQNPNKILKSESFDTLFSATTNGWYEQLSRVNGQNFGYSTTHNVTNGVASGEAGGQIARRTMVALYADIWDAATWGKLSLNDSLSVTGKFAWTGANGSQSSTIIGFLDSSRAGTTGEVKGTFSAFDFNSPYSGDNILKLLKPYLGKDSDKTVGVFACPSAKPHSGGAAPTPWSSTAIIVSGLVIEKGLRGLRNPSRVVVMQEHYVLMNSIWYEPEPAGGGAWTQWHTWTDSTRFEWSGTPREHYNNMHEEGGNLVMCDGHAEYKKNRQTSSLDWGLVDANGNDSPWQPNEGHSRAAYYVAP